MNASQETIAALLELQKADLAIMQTRKALEQLPQRERIVEMRKKRQVISGKKDQVAGLIAKVRGHILSIEDESGRLAEKKREIQQAIDDAKGDYRNLEARTKELEGIAKREETLENELVEATSQLEKAEGVDAQIERALAAIDKEEGEATASFREEGGALQERIAKEQTRHDALLAALPDDLADLYLKTASRCGGVAVAVLSGSSCGACRTAISHERLIDIRRQAPLSTCPACHRLLVVV